MNQNGRGTLTPSDDPGHSEQHLSQQPLDAAATTARLRGISSNSQRPPVQGQPVSTQSSQHYTNQKSALQLKAHQRLAESSAHKLAPVSSKRPHAPSTLGSHKSALVAKKLSAQEQVTEEVADATRAVRQMENRIATDLTRAIKCTIGTKCLEHNLIDAENSADRFFRKSVASNSQHTKQASVLHSLGAKLTKSGGIQPDAVIPEYSSTYSNPAASNTFWKEAAEIAKSPGDTKRKTKNSAKTFVKQLAAAVHEAAHAAAPPEPLSLIGPMTATKSKTFR
jgi:hypothetical protein